MVWATAVALGLGALLLLSLGLRSVHRSRARGKMRFAHPSRSATVADLLPTISGVLIGFTASIIIYSLNIDSDARNTILMAFNVRNTAVTLELIAFISYFTSFVLSLHIKSRNLNDESFSNSPPFEEAEFAREQAYREVELMSSLSLLAFAVAVGMLLLGLTVAASQYLQDLLVQLFAWASLYAIVMLVPLALSRFVLPRKVDRLACNVRVQLSGRESALTGRMALWRAAADERGWAWEGTLAVFTDEDYSALRGRYLRQEPVQVALERPGAPGSAGGAGPRAAPPNSVRNGDLPAYIQAMDLPGRPLRARLGGTEPLPELFLREAHQNWQPAKSIA